MNVYKYELKQNKRFLIIWCISLSLFTALLMQATPLFIDEAAAMKEVLISMGSFIKALNINIDTFFSEVGFFSYILVYLGLICAVQATLLGINIISKERRMKTADFLISKPKSRSKIFIEKVLAAFTCIIVTEIFFFLSAFLSMLFIASADFAIISFILMCLSLIFIQIIFLGIGLVAAILIPKIKSPISITIGITFSIFFLGMLEGITGSKIIRYFSPLKYFDNNYIINHNTYEFQYIILSLLLSAVLYIISYIIYINKDVQSV